ncbi:MAG: hypothetical protein Q9202_004583 [Teloschistes flavicans]
MSLNGLDATEVHDAYQAAVGEGGGWFLLKYETRDEVNLLRKGTGGVVDIRETIVQYNELSPLYGFEEKSHPQIRARGHFSTAPRHEALNSTQVVSSLIRVAAARVSVHFQAITEHFTPHDTVFSFATAKGLNDVALTSACSLHTASASIKSSSDSLRQRGLSGIAEDASEFPSLDTDPKSANAIQEVTAGTTDLQAQPERADSFSNSCAPSTLPSPETEAANSPPPTLRNVDKALPPTPDDNTEDKGTTRHALEDAFLDTRSSIEGRRPSIQSNRPSIRTTRTSYEYKPKIKMGPRPSHDSSGRRLSSDRATDFRPISTLPNGVRLPSKKQVPGRPKSASGRAPIPEMPEAPLPSPKFVSQTTIPGTPVAPLLCPTAKQIQPSESKSSTMTPEKRRLKKALELRQKQLAARNATRNDQSDGHSQGPIPKSSADDSKRVSLTATLPDISPGDDSGTDVLQERMDHLREDPGLVHVGPQDVGKDIPENFEVSPISILEASDGPSTQASSISDEDETPTMPEPNHDEGFRDDKVASIAIEMPTISDNISLPIPEKSKFDNPDSGAETADIIENRDQDIAAGGPFERQITGPRGSMATPNAPEGQPEISKSNSISEDYLISSWSPVDNSISPLSFQRSSSAKSVNMDPEVIDPHEIPLPPIDEDEVISLTPQREAFIERSASRFQADGGGNQNQDTSQTQEEIKGSTEIWPSSADASIEQRERRARRQGLINPIKRISSPDCSDEQSLSDDSFMEELKSATVQEAKPISVSKSPIMPIFPRSVPESKSSEHLRPTSASSNRLHRPKRQDDQPLMPKLPDLYSARSSSAPYTPLHEAQLSPPTLKKMGVSSGISQRIKALEQLSTRPSSPSSQLSSPSTAPGSSPAFPNPRKTSFRASQAAREIAKASTKFSTARAHMPSPQPPLRSPDENPPKQLGDSVVRVDRIDVTTKDGKTRPESISVTARIIRGSQNKVPRVNDDPSRSETMDLYSSPLTVEHQSARPISPLSPLKPPKPLYSRSISSTSSAQKSDPFPAPRRSSISNRLSSTLSRRGSEPELLHSPSDTSLNSTSNVDGSKEENRKESRKSRLFKRMSNISAASRRSIASALSPVRKDIKEEPIVEHHEPSRETIKPTFSSIEIGDVNVQFPDTLLWKRRHICIDGKGLLVLSASKADNNSKVVTKRYPLTEFNPPYLPDQEMQELPNSVVLDFRDGSTLQCACENAYTRNEVLMALREAHQMYNT